MHWIRLVHKGGRRRPRPLVWGLVAVLATALLALAATLVWLARPAPLPLDGLSLPRVSAAPHWTICHKWRSCA